METAAYRDWLAPALMRREELVARRRDELAREADRLRMLRLRMVRTGAGLGLAAAGSVLWVRASQALGAASGSWLLPHHSSHLHGVLTKTLVEAWLWAAAGGLAGWLGGSLAGKTHDVVTTDDVAADVARLEGTSTYESLRSTLRRIEPWSVALPLVGIALCVPLTLHFIVAALAGWLSDFDQWITWSVTLVGPAHLVLVVASVYFAAWLKGARTELIREETRYTGWKVLALTTVAGLIPGGMLLGIPTLIVAVTGAVFIPASFALIRDAIVRERRALART